MPGLVGPLPSPDAVKPGRQRHVPVNANAPSYRPDPLPQWRDDTSEAWDRFWSSDLIGVAIDVDVPSMLRLFSYYDLWQRAYIAYTQGDLLGYNAKLEEKVHPLLVTMLKVGEAASKLEERFGITPYLRAKLGIKVGEATNTAEKLNRPARQRRGAIDVESE